MTIDWTIISLALGIFISLCAIIGFLYRKVHKMDNVINRPYPCEYLKALEDKVDKHAEYLSNDREKLMEIELNQTKMLATEEYIVKSVDELKEISNKMLIILAETKK